MVQLVNAVAIFVADSTLKFSPAFSISPNWKTPPGSKAGLINCIAFADQTLRPGKMAMDAGAFNPEAKTEPTPPGVNFCMVPLPPLATYKFPALSKAMP